MRVLTSPADTGAVSARPAGPPQAVVPCPAVEGWRHASAFEVYLYQKYRVQRKGKKRHKGYSGRTPDAEDTQER